jgi:hypothetical protein
MPANIATANDFGRRADRRERQDARANSDDREYFISRFHAAFLSLVQHRDINGNGRCRFLQKSIAESNERRRNNLGSEIPPGTPGAAILLCLGP